MNPLIRPSIRTRLALVSGGVFFAMGLGLMAISYVIVDRSLSPAATRGPIAAFVGSPPSGATRPAMAPGEPPGTVTAAGAITVGGPGPGEASTVIGLQRLITDVRVQTLDSLVWTWAALVGIMAVVSGGFGWLLSARILRPLRDITGTARRLSVANLHERIGLEGPPDELKELADTFDGMLGRLDGAFASQRRFVANASHELRTPLAIMRAQVDVALADPEVSRAELVATSLVVRDAVDRCERLLDGLLVLARSDRGLESAEPVDLADSAARALAAATLAAAERGIVLRSTLSPATVAGDRALLDRLVANLVENAVSYNRSAGWVEVTTANGGDTALLRVANSGTPVPPDRVASLFEPFRRLSRERTGSGRGAGLGLSIVRAVARAHGGDVTASARPDGGMTVEVELPA